MLFIGVDVGANGGWALIDERGHIRAVTKTPASDADLAHLLWEWRRDALDEDIRATVEKVGSSPQMGVKSAFSFGRAYGVVRMALASQQIPYDEVTPLVWQRKMQCLSAGDKNVTKQRAQQLFPRQVVTHAIADALLLAEYGRIMMLAGS